MPTILLLDKSLSMKRPAILSEEQCTETRLSLAKQGIATFLSYLDKVFPLEQVCFMAFSSTCEMLNPFTRCRSDILEQLRGVSTEDRTDLRSAVQSMISMVTKEWGAFVPIQIILITDGTVGVAQALSRDLVCFPFPCQFHVMFLDTIARDDSAIDHLLASTDLVAENIFLPTDAKLTGASVREMFLSLTQVHYRPHNGVLKCGNLQSNISLTPSPKMSLSQFDLAVHPSQRFPNPYRDYNFPSELNIVGFFDISSVSAPPVYSRHFVLDMNTNDDQLQRIIAKLKDDGSDANSSAPNENGDPDNIMTKPSFRVLLHGSLKCDSKVALVQLREDWFGFLYSATSTTKKANLVISVLFPKTELPWLGPFKYLGPKASTSDPRGSKSASPFPVSTPHTLSYQAQPGQLCWAKESCLQSDLSKIARYSHKLPDKEVSLVKELNKLRQVVMTYSMPGLVDIMCTILQSEETSTNNQQAKAILQHCIQFLRNNLNPHDKLGPLAQKL